ncbi:MAG TPA: single-stranded DNA-binding protein [Solirubrobacterales bacterium]
MSTYNTNVVVVSGRLTHDPKLSEPSRGEAQGEKVYSVLRLAINTPNGRGGTKPIYEEVKCWNGLARACVEHKRKGDLVTVTGRLDQYNKPGDGGRWKYITAESVEFAGRRDR